MINGWLICYMCFFFYLYFIWYIKRVWRRISRLLGYYIHVDVCVLYMNWTWIYLYNHYFFIKKKIKIDNKIKNIIQEKSNLWKISITKVWLLWIQNVYNNQIYHKIIQLIIIFYVWIFIIIILFIKRQKNIIMTFGFQLYYFLYYNNNIKYADIWYVRN